MSQELAEQIRLYTHLTGRTLEGMTDEQAAAYLAGEGHTEMVRASIERTSQTHRAALDMLRDM